MNRRPQPFVGTLVCLVLGALLGCTSNTTVLETWSEDPKTLRRQCENTTSPELQTTCWIQLAALHGRSGKVSEVEGIKSCAEISKSPLALSSPKTQQVWEWECAFRLGEELANAGDVAVGLKHCSMAGRFAQNCITHAIWRSPLDQTLHSDQSTSKLWAHAQEQTQISMSNLQGLTPELQADAYNQLIGAFGLKVYFGSGVLNPEPAHLKDDWGASLRTGYALERVRLATSQKDRWSSDDIQQLFDQILEDWKNNRPVKGAAHPNPWTMGRYGEARLSPFEKDIPKLNLYGGGKRLIHSNPEIDMRIALMEAMFWYPHTPPAWFTTQLENPETHIRVTAAKLSCLSNALRTNIGSKLPKDTTVQWHAQHCPLLK